MVDFVRTISESEVKYMYLNLTDDYRNTHGYELPDHKSRLLVVDQRGRKTYAQKHHENQVWGTIYDWFKQNAVKPGMRIRVRYDTVERIDGLPVVHLDLEASSVPESVLSAELPTSDELVSPPEPRTVSLELERQLEDFLEANLDALEPKLSLFVDDAGQRGRQYPTDVGVIDLLCRSKDGDFVIIELKRGRISDVVVGQIARYMGWVRRELAGEHRVRGIIVSHEADDRLNYAAAAFDTLKVVQYRVRIEIIHD